MDKNDYNKLLRVLGLLASVSLWALSVYFSSKGFGFEMGGELAWIGVVLALVITILQIIWNHEARRANLTIFVVGLVSYLYGIWANVSGISGLRGDISMLSDPLGFLFPLLLGLFVEVVPEPLLVWSITGEWSTGDFFGNLINTGANVKSAPPQKSRRSSQHKPQQPPEDLMKILEEKGFKPLRKPGNVS